LNDAARFAAAAADHENGLAGHYPWLLTALVVASLGTVVVITSTQVLVVRRVGREGRVAAVGAGLAWLLWGGACAGMLLGLSDLLFWAGVRPAIQFLLMGLAFGASPGVKRRAGDWVSVLADGWLAVGGSMLSVWLLLTWQDVEPVSLAGDPGQWIGLGFIVLDAVTLSALLGLVVRAVPERRRHLGLISVSSMLSLVGDIVAVGTNQAENGIPFWLLSGILITLAAAAGADGLFQSTFEDPDVPQGIRLWQLPVVPFVLFVFGPERPDLVAQLIAGTVAFVLFAQVVSRSRQNIRLWESLRLRTRHYDEVLRDSRDVVLQLDAGGTVMFASAAAVEVLGFRPGELVGTRFADRIHPDDLARHTPAAEELVTRGGSLLIESRYRFADDHWRHLEWSVNGQSENAGWVVAGRDISDRIRMQQELTRQSRTDPLTGLLNRTAFLADVDDRLAQGPAVVIVADLDHFKPVNDTLGQASGDALLQRIADWLEQAVGPADAVARLGGDEFAVLPASTDLAVAEEFGRAVVAAASAVDTQASGRQPVSASVGIAAVESGRTAISALRDADLAMYRAKLRGGASAVVFEPWMSERVFERSRQRAELEAVVRGGGLALHLQPVVDLHTLGWDGFEALVRWPVGEELRSPAQFIPLAEETGLIVPMGTWVLAEGLLQLTRWPDDRAGIAVNVSALQLAEDDFTQTVTDALAAAGLAPNRLTLEITEQAAVQDLGRTASRLAPLRELGVHVAVDDFGTGFSSMQYLTRLPVDILKIDRRFVSGLGVAPEDEVLVRSMIGLAEDLGLGVIAEGVETQRQADQLRAFGCRLAQGFLFSQPRPLAELLRVRAEQEAVGHVPGAAAGVPGSRTPRVPSATRPS
jgi:diguanylate cyclase (GGDEF)-like protein/PAS domain S-box-containing protein